MINFIPHTKLHEITVSTYDLPASIVPGLVAETKSVSIESPVQSLSNKSAHKNSAL